MKNIFQDQTVIVTGASSGIGRETALAFAASGANVVLAARRQDVLAEVVNGHNGSGGRMLALTTDVTRDDDVQRLVDETLSRFGRIDILVNNAGLGIRAGVEQTRPDDARTLMEVNFFGALRCIHGVLPHMKKQGRGTIVNVGSVLSVLATPRNAMYCASKFALRALSDSLRLELRDSGIRVILVMPGYIDTPFFDNQIHYGEPRRATRMKGLPAPRAAQAILKACARGKRELVITVPAKLGIWTKRFAPGVLDFFLARIP